MALFTFPLLLAGASLAAAAPRAVEDAFGLAGRSNPASPYTPVFGSCPSTPLVRVADGLSASEAAWATARKPVADAALVKWLASTGASFPTTSNYPVVGLTTSGGGLRSLLTGAGVHQALDGLDSNVSTSGLYQSLTYESGLSGGSWLLSSISSNDWPTVSSLQKNLWTMAFNDSLPDPPHFKQVEKALALALLGKHENFTVGLVDVYGRLLGYQLLLGKDGGVKHHVSDITSLSNFTSHKVPYPIITALGVDMRLLTPPPNATQYEFHPYEFGSWDTGVEAFAPIKYLGSNLTNGKPTTANQCVTGYDNQGFVLGTSSNIFTVLKAEAGANYSAITQLAAPLKELGIKVGPESFFAAYPNPFFRYSGSPGVKSQRQLNLVDGGVSSEDQGDPIWPMLHRPVDVLIVGANSADTAKNFPSGAEIRNTYLRAQATNLTRMPYIPPAAVFKAQGLNERPVFFGCDKPGKMTIIYLANRDISFDSGTSTFEIQYSPAKTAKMIKNGGLVATNDGDKGWGACLGCAIMKKTGETLPAVCTACFKKYCFAPTPPS